jgi:hypothetical protein
MHRLRGIQSLVTGAWASRFPSGRRDSVEWAFRYCSGYPVSLVAYMGHNEDDTCPHWRISADNLCQGACALYGLNRKPCLMPV